MEVNVSWAGKSKLVAVEVGLVSQSLDLNYLALKTLLVALEPQKKILAVR